jgi:hypothetical protein
VYHICILPHHNAVAIFSMAHSLLVRPDLGDSYELPPNLLPVVIYSRWDVIMASWWSVHKFCIFPCENVVVIFSTAHSLLVKPRLGDSYVFPPNLLPVVNYSIWI